MDIRRLPASQGLAWFRQTIDLGAKNPRAVFGAAALAIVTLYAAALAMVLLAGLLLAGTRAVGPAPGLGLIMAVAVPLTMVLMLLVPILLGGLMHVIREAETGRAVRARDVFVPLHSAHGRRLAWLGLVQVALAVAGGVLTVALAGSDYWRDYLQAMQGALQGSTPAMPEPRHAGLLFLVQLVFNYFSYAMMLFAIPLMLFSGRPLGNALVDALRASVTNIAANLLAGVLFMAALVLAALVVALLASLLAALGGIVHPVLGALLMLLIMLGFAAVVLVVVVGAAYLAWRDTFGDGAVPPPPPLHAFEA